MNRKETPKHFGLIEKFNFQGFKLKKEPDPEIVLYTAGLLSKISNSFPNPDLEKIYADAKKEIELSTGKDPMMPVARALLNEAIDFLRKNLVIK